MDTFEEKVRAMKNMAPEEVQAAVEKLKSMCVCQGCPSYNRCAKEGNESLFCSSGKSFMCISDEKSCICPTCPVPKEMGLKYTFFCTRGAEKAQRYEHTVWGTKMV
ncbi:DUF2769 domain-containing protein [Methanofollis aquaemaris]|uniref:DUF2769 domain-containing protein n=1 Tax=Methanofollis aquaemaris TaxID=126734 RepID=A0A8A3S5X0_9EURY|nr:DUF2769 domain-containing protein [Methanofollis aquaemaris]QSZ67323.1 DUF2769 domain-containing protein [Methanofollis aquaemaris]